MNNCHVHADNREDNKTNIGRKTVTRRIANHQQPLIWGSWTWHGVWSAMGSQIGGVPSRTRLLLLEATPSDSLNDIGDPRRFWEGNQNRRHSHHAFPPSILAQRWESKSFCWRYASVSFPTSFSPCMLTNVLRYILKKKVPASDRDLSKGIKGQKLIKKTLAQKKMQTCYHICLWSRDHFLLCVPSEVNAASGSKVPKLLPVPDSNLVVTQSLHTAFCVQTNPLSHFSPGACGLHSACHGHKLSK